MMVKRTAMMCGVLAIVLASSALAIDRVVDPTPVAKRAPAEVSVNGVTPEEFLERQRELHAWLITQMPEGIDRAALSVALTDQERASITAPNASGVAAPMRVGVVKSLRDRVGLARGQDLSRTAKAAHSVMTQTADGGFVWATAVSSPGAVALRVHLTDFSMPANAEAYFLSQEGEAYGPYVGGGPNDSGDFWTNSVMSSTGIVLVRYYGMPEADDLAGLSLQVSEVGHVAIDFPRPPAGGIASFCTFNEPCVENATCQNTGPAAAAETAVAKMRWIKRPFVYICTGGLIADTDPGTEIPYFLTANHCLSSNKVAANLEAYFLYQVSCGTTICAGSFDPAPAPSTLGATVVATDSAGDFTLLQLSEAPPAGTTYLGWNNSPIAYTNGAGLYRIHHPSGAPQAYSEHEVDTTAGTCSGWPRGERIYSNDVYGATEGGSSGSPVLNASGEIVGQLSGCCGYNCGDVCDTASNSTVDGALAYYWAAVEPFLNPSGGGCTTDDDCDDNDACNGLETCVDTVCQSGTPVDCDDGDACTADSCAPATGACSNDPISCDDADACTVDSCDPATGCINDWAACGLADGCCGPDCDSTNDPDCEECVPSGGYCTSSAECCSGSCHPAKNYCR